MAILDWTLGPILLGTFLNVWLYGILITQMTLYFVVHKQDKPWLKMMVAWLLLLDTLNTVFDIGFVYRYTITLFGDFRAITHSHWFFHVAPLMTVMISSTTQGFYAWRITRLTGHAWIGWCITAATVVQFLAGLGTTIGAWIIVDFARFGEMNATISIWLTMSAVTDVAITCILCWYLKSHRTGFPHTDDVITRIIRVTMQTGLITTLWAVVDLILFLAVPNTLHLLLNLPLCKLYTNSLMSTLNSRGGWGSGMTGSGNGSTNGISIHVSALRERDNAEVRDKDRLSAQSPRSGTLPRKTGTQNRSEADDSFELDEYSKTRRVDLEEGEGDRKTSLSQARMSNITKSRPDAARQISVTQLQLPTCGADGGGSDESFHSPSAGHDEK